MDTRVYRAFEQQVEMGKEGAEGPERLGKYDRRTEGGTVSPRFRLCGYGR